MASRQLHLFWFHQLFNLSIISLKLLITTQKKKKTLLKIIIWHSIHISNISIFPLAQLLWLRSLSSDIFQVLNEDNFVTEFHLPASENSSDCLRLQQKFTEMTPHSVITLVVLFLLVVYIVLVLLVSVRSQQFFYGLQIWFCFFKLIY